MATMTFEERLADLESKVEDLLNHKGEGRNPAPWLEQWFGAFKDSPGFDAAMQRGAEYRRSQPMPADEQGTDVSA